MILRLLVTALLALLPRGAAAHGEHVAAAPLGIAPAVRMEGYWLELLTHPAPLAAAARGHLVVKISADPTRAPVSGARVLVGLVPAREHAHASHNHSHGTELAYASEVTGAGQYEQAVTLLNQPMGMRHGP